MAVQDVNFMLSTVEEYDFEWRIRKVSEKLCSRDNRVFLTRFNRHYVCIQGPVFGKKDCFELKLHFIPGSVSYLYADFYGKQSNISNVKIYVSVRNIINRLWGEKTQVGTSLDLNGPPTCPDIIDNTFQIPGNDLIVRGSVSFCMKVEICDPRPNCNVLPELSKDLKTMYRSGSEFDITFYVDEQKLHAHKNILCSRSPVFAKMMEHNLLEKASNCVTITDIQSDIFDRFLLFLYSGEMEDGDLDAVLSLYSAGDKYQVPSLRQKCSRILESKLEVDTVCRILKIAFLHGDDDLKDKGKDFMRSHFSEVGQTADWVDIITTNTQLASEVMIFVTSCIAKPEGVKVI